MTTSTLLVRKSFIDLELWPEISTPASLMTWTARGCTYPAGFEPALMIMAESPQAARRKPSPYNIDNFKSLGWKVTERSGMPLIPLRTMWLLHELPVHSTMIVGTVSISVDLLFDNCFALLQMSDNVRWLWNSNHSTEMARFEFLFYLPRPTTSLSLRLYFQYRFRSMGNIRVDTIRKINVEVRSC